MFEIDLNATNPELVWQDTLISHSSDSNDVRPNLLDSRGLISTHSAYLFIRGRLYGSPWGNGDAVGGPF